MEQAKSLTEVFGKDETKVQSLFQAVKLVKSIHLRNLYDEKMEQLRLKQVMNLKAKGFFLDNADDICRQEFQEHLGKKDRMKEMFKRQNELLNIIGGKDEMKALQASEDLRKLTLDIQETMNEEEQEQLKAIRQMKLIELKNRLQENADSEFSEFKG